MKKLLLITAAAVALCAAALPAEARICKDGGESTAGGWCTAAPPLITDWCGNAGQEKCIPVDRYGKCPGKMDPGADGACSITYDGPHKH